VIDMAKRLELCGEMVTIGDLVEEDMPAQLLGTPAIQLRTADGRVITITGLSREECRTAAPLFGKQMSVSLS
jgi:hypothetical protein